MNVNGSSTRMNNMIKKYGVLSAGLFGMIFLLFFIIKQAKKDQPARGEVEIALREVGNQLLLDNGDSTSLIPPVRKLDQSTYELTFESELSIVPDSLVTTLGTAMSRIGLPADYLVQVQIGGTDETAYGYKISSVPEESLIPCIGRALPLRHYAITINFIDHRTEETLLANITEPFVFLGIFSVLLILGLVSLAGRNLLKTSSTSTRLGQIKFDSQSRKLSLKDTEIELSETETELLSLLAQKTNQVITRDELLKEVWENKGVVVSRSLDTFISRLRKKLALDRNISIRNFRGKGYMLEIQD